MVTVYGRSGCVQCDATIRTLEIKSVGHRYVEVNQVPAAAAFTRYLGHLKLPVVMAGPMQWLGFRPDLIVEMARHGG